jgi:hypothetical protein
LCIETALSASETTHYTVGSPSDPLDRDEVIAYVENLPKPVTIRAERKDGEPIALHTAPKQPSRGVAPLDIGQSLRETLALEEDSLILVKRENEPQFSMRVSGLALWQHSYHLIGLVYMSVVHEADASAKASHASAVMRVGKTTGPHVSAAFLR